MKNRKKFMLLIIGIFILLLLFSVVQIYAKYLTSSTGKTNLKIAKWNISVNKKSIKNNSDISSSIIPVFEGNDNISAGIIAPTATGYFDLDFDFSDADVTFKYEINVSADVESSVQDLVSTGYSIDDGEIIKFNNFNETISDTILLNSNIKQRKIRVYILWNDDEETSSMTNEADTLSAKEDKPALLDVNISFTQVAE